MSIYVILNLLQRVISVYSEVILSRKASSFERFNSYLKSEYFKCLKQYPQLEKAKKLHIYSGGHAYDKQTSTVFSNDSYEGGGVE